jgi:16S rRNA processing protein RimM
VDKNSDWVVIGRFGRPHGIKGLISIISFTDPRDNILSYTDWHAYINKQWQPVKLLDLTSNNKSILAKVDGYVEREDLAYLTNIDIGIKSEQLPMLDEGEFYWSQLVGMEVVTVEGISLGQVTEILSTGANDVLVVVGEKRHLIPYLPGKSIIKVNDSQRIITVDWDMDF